jgi:hypothetical protein
VYEAVRPTHSGHGGEDDFEHDVKNGKSVLLSTKFWYFGKGDEFNIGLPECLKQMIPGRGHRSDGNNPLRDQFVLFLAKRLILDALVNVVSTVPLNMPRKPPINQLALAPELCRLRTTRWVRKNQPEQTRLTSQSSCRSRLLLKIDCRNLPVYVA